MGPADYDYWRQRYHLESFYQKLNKAGQKSLCETLLAQYQLFCSHCLPNRTANDLQAVAKLLEWQPERICLDVEAPQFGDALPHAQRASVYKHLQVLSPWRKGPFSVFGVDLDAEWRSNLKWNKIASILGDISGQTILDVGCGNGYYVLRLLGAGADWVLGIDGNALCTAQFMPFGCWLNESAWVLPGRLEMLPMTGHFDWVLSMGVLSHQRQPQEHLKQLKGQLGAGGRLLLETLIIEPQHGDLLLPEDRYARMRNVWMLPSPDTLIQWLEASGFKQIQFIRADFTQPSEQRPTEWMSFESLQSSLDQANPALTVEGYPAPLRGIFSAYVAD